MSGRLQDLPALRAGGARAGVVSICSAHPAVLRAALRHAAGRDGPILIEATCNQVNQHGGYTGMRPADFARLVLALADAAGCPRGRVILGGDHLGPNPWRDRPAPEALAEAATMIDAYVAAGFRKLHLDASMGCAGEADALDDETIARRAAGLCAAAETAAARCGGAAPVYVIGTEVPPPGGADHALDAVTPTTPAAARATLAVHRRVFAEAGLADALARVVGLVVQPGVEFGNHNVVRYDRDRARALAAVLDDAPGCVFEAHSTDYQGDAPLAALVEDGFAILKVGPELTFVLRETLYALDLIASDLSADYGDRPLMRAMEAAMLRDPQHWRRHYPGDAAQARWLRHYSLSDRIRYYWPTPEAVAAVDRLTAALAGRHVPAPLMRQHLPGAGRFADAPLDVSAVLDWRIALCLRSYDAACRG